MSRPHLRQVARLSRSGYVSLLLLASTVSSCGDGGSGDSGPGATPSDSNTASTEAPLSCRAPDVLHTGMGAFDLVDSTFHDDAFYLAGSSELVRVPLNTGIVENVVSFATEAGTVLFGESQIVAIPYHEQISVLDYQGQTLATIGNPGDFPDGYYLDEANNQLILVYLDDTPRHDTLDLTTGLVTSYDFSVGDSGWVDTFQSTSVWDVGITGGVAFASASLEHGLVFRMDLGSNTVTRFAEDIPSGDLLVAMPDAVYITSSNDRDAAEWDTYKMSLDGENREAVTDLHGKRFLSQEFFIGFDSALYYRDLGPVYRIDGVVLNQVGYVESDCLRDGFGQVSDTSYGLLHPSSNGSDPETVIVRLK